MTELQQVKSLERQLRSAIRWLYLALFFIKAAIVLGLAGIILFVAGNWRWWPTIILSLMAAAISFYCKWASGTPEGSR